jgi:hypothetical protein
MDLSKVAIILNLILLFAGGGVVWGIQRADVDYLKQRIDRVESSSKEGLTDLKDDIKYLRQEQANQYREISTSLLAIKENYRNNQIASRRSRIYLNDTN